MPRSNSTQRTPYSLTNEEARLVNTFRKIDIEDKHFILAVTQRAAARRVTKPNHLHLISGGSTA